MIRSFYLSLVGLCTIGALSSCADKAEVETRTIDSSAIAPERPKGDVMMLPSPIPEGQLFTIEYTQHAIDSMMAMPQASQLRTPDAAAQYHLTLPPKLTVPPHLLPAKDIKVTDRSDSTAQVKFTPIHVPMTARLELKRVGSDSASLWLVDKVIMLHRRP